MCLLLLRFRVPTTDSETRQLERKLNDNPNVCDVNPLFAGPQCTLRAAIQEANQTIGSDTITFQMPDNPNIPGAEVKPIEIASALPKITERVTIDGPRRTARAHLATPIMTCSSRAAPTLWGERPRAWPTP